MYYILDWPGHLSWMDKKLSEMKGRAYIQAVKEDNQRMKYDFISTSTSSYKVFQEDCSSDSSEDVDWDNSPALIESSEPGASKSVVRKILLL